MKVQEKTNNEIINLTIQNLMKSINEAFRQQKIQKKFQKLYFLSLEMLPKDLKLKSLTNQSSYVQQKGNLFQKIEKKHKKREFLKKKLILIQKIIPATCQQISQRQVFELLNQFRKITVQYIENIFELCRQLSLGQDLVQERLHDECGRIFIQLQQNSIINRILYIFIEPIVDFDPLLIKIQIKPQKRYQVSNLLHFNTLFHQRLVKASQQMFRITNNLQSNHEFKMHIQGLKSFLDNYSFQDTQKMHKPSIHKSSPRRFSLNIQSHVKNQSQVKNETLKRKDIQNFRKKKIKSHLTKSLDILQLQVSDQQETKSLSTQKCNIKQLQNRLGKKKLLKTSKILNFKAVELQPLHARTQQSCSSLEINQNSSLCQINNGLKKVVQFNIRTKKYKKLSELSNRPQITHQTGNYGSSLRNESQHVHDGDKKQSLTQRKLSSLIAKRQYHRFQPHNDERINFSNETLQKKFSLLKQTCVDQNDKSDKIQVFGQANQKNRESGTITTERCKQQSIEQQQGVNEIAPYGVLDVNLCMPPEIPQPSGQIDQPSTRQNQNVQAFGRQIKNKQEKQQSQKKNEEKEKKKILLKAPKLNIQQIHSYFSQFNIPQNNDLIIQMLEHQHYINQFYLNQTIFCVIIFSVSSNFNQLQIRLIHQVGDEVNSSFRIDIKTRQRLRKQILKNFISFAQKASKSINQIIFKDKKQQCSWFLQCGFTFDGQQYIRKFMKNDTELKKQFKQFLSMNLSILSIRQSDSENYLYSDEISPFRSGKYDIDQNILFDSSDSEFYQEFKGQFTSINDINSFLETRQIDTFDADEEIDALIEKESQKNNQKINFKILTFHQNLNRKFIAQNGWISTISTLIFHEKNQLISQLLLNNGYEIYFGKGFQHIGTMKNKIVHYKTGFSSQKIDKKTKEITTKIRMFSKQLYGLIKHDNEKAFYGNWEMNFHFKHQFMGKIHYLIEKQNQENNLMFGHSKFFVTVYNGDQFLIGWEVEDNDFLF